MKIKITTVVVLLLTLTSLTYFLFLGNSTAVGAEPIIPCTTPPCQNLDCDLITLVSSPSFCDDPNAPDVQYFDLSFQNISSCFGSCTPVRIRLDDYSTDCTLAVEGVDVEIVNFPFDCVLEPGEAIENLLVRVTIDPALCKGIVKCTLTPQATDLTRSAPAKVKPGEIYVSCKPTPFYIELGRNTTGQSRSCLDAPAQLEFCVINCSPVERTLRVTVRSKQETSTNGKGDHFPISFDKGSLRMGNPKREDPYSIRRFLTLPAGIGSKLPVSIWTRAYPPCEPGSSCGYTLLVKDVTPGSGGGTAVAKRNNTVFSRFDSATCTRDILSPDITLISTDPKGKTAKIGEQVDFRIKVPTCEQDGLSTGHVVLGMSGSGRSGEILDLGGGFILRITPDALTAKTLNDPGLDATWQPGTDYLEASQYPIPNEPALIGQRIWMAGFSQRGGQFRSISPTKSFELVP